MGQKLNILMITSQRRFKANARGFSMSKNLIERGHRVTLMVISDQRRSGIVTTDWDGVPTVETPDLLWGRLRSGWDAWGMLNRMWYLGHSPQHYDIVHSLDTRPATIYPALQVARRHHAPLLTDWIDWWGRGGIIDEFRPRWYRLLFGGIETLYEESFRASVDGVTVISTALGQRALGLGVKPERLYQLPNGCWPDVFNVPDKAACRQKVGLEGHPQIIGFSSLDTHFDFNLVIEAMASVVRQYPQAKLLITGKPSHEVTEMARSYGLEQNLILTGFLPYEQLPWYLGCADLFVMPFPDRIFNVGRWPSKMNDYMTVGRPIVSNPIGDVKNVFEAHRVGLLAQWNAEDFAQKITLLLEQPSMADELGRNAREAAVKVYNWKVIIAGLEEFYLKMLAKA